MLKPILYLHVGTHKTGSTAIQRVLGYNNSVLGKQGAKYMYFPENFRSIYEARSLDNLSDETLSDFKKIIQENLNSQTKSYIMSWESFSGDYYNGYSDANRIAKHLKSVLAEYFNVKVLIYLRKQDEFLESLYTQTIHTGKSWSFDSFIKTYDTKAFNWYELVNAYEQHFSKENIVVKIYDKKYFPEKDSLLIDFFKTIKIDYNRLLISDYMYTVNSGYSFKALEFARHVNENLTDEEKQFLRVNLQNISSKKPYEKYSYWKPTARVEFMNEYKESNSKIAKQYLHIGEVALFSEFKTDKFNAVQNLELDDILSILIKIQYNNSKNENKLYSIKLLAMLENKFLSFLNRSSFIKSKLKTICFKLKICS